MLQRSALQLQMVLALTLVLVLTLDLAQICRDQNQEMQSIVSPSVYFLIFPSTGCFSLIMPTRLRGNDWILGPF